ncbi:MAG: lyase family protein [Pseudomonadota bacterium]
MAISLADSGLWGALYGDAELQGFFTDSAELRAMLLVEGALARAEGELGIIPELAAQAIHRASRDVLIDPAALAERTARDGVAVPALVAAFRDAMAAPDHSGWVHWGATSQDIQDTGLSLRLRRVLELLDARLDALLGHLGRLADVHAQTVIAARTRWQIATPTTLGARIATWGAPLLETREALRTLSPRVAQLSLAGASGNNAALRGQGSAVAQAMARDLGLTLPPVPWHTARDGVRTLAGWCGTLLAALAKIAQDLLLSALLGEGLRAGAAGGSSTMPHKSNPTGAETLGALAAHGQALVPAVQTPAQAFERDGRAWGAEMLALPGMVVTTGAALARAEALMGDLSADAVRLRAPLDAAQGLTYAEAASFHWAASVGLAEARSRVKAACEIAATENRHLRDVLTQVEPRLDWAAVFDTPDTGDAAEIARGFSQAVLSWPGAGD